MDTSRRLLKQARAAARTASTEIERVKSDTQAFQRPASFEPISSLNASFGRFADRQNRPILDHLRATLAPGGVWLLDIVGGRQRLDSGAELRDLLLSVGFASVQLAGGLGGHAPYDESARRLVAVARARTRALAED